MKHFYRALYLALFCCLSWTVSAETPPLEADFFTTCADRTASNTTQCIDGNNLGLNYGGYILLDGYNNHYTLSNGRFVESLDGTARLTGTWTNVANSNIRWVVDIRLSGRTSVKPANSPKDHHCLTPNTNNFYYYTHTSGTLSGRRDVSGASINVSRFGEAFQVGVGANVTHNQLTFGASGWLMLSLDSQPSNGIHLNLLAGNNGQNGDVNINLSGSASDCMNNSGSISLNCPNDITVTAGQGQTSASVSYKTPNATTTCMVDGGVDCNAIPNTISGFKYLGERNGSKYYCSNTNDFTWHEARAYAINSGGHLVTICSEGENEFIRSRLLNVDAWIGYTDEQNEGEYKWVTGETCTFSKWRTSSGEPNNGGTYQDEHYTRLLRDENGQWTDRNAHYRTEFVMEIPCSSTMNPGGVTVNRTSGLASGSNFPVGMTTVTYEAIDECGNSKTCSFKVTVNAPVDPCSGNGSPAVTVEKTNPDCGQANGKIKFLFGDNAGRTNIEFSLDGGNTYPLNVSDNVGMAMFGDLSDGNYDIYVRWGNDECSVDLGNVNLNDGSSAPGTACNDGNSNTENDVIQADGCSCIGEVIDPCADKGGDNDNDGVCFDDDCNDFNPNVGARQTPGTSCDDGNPNTINDVIQDDGCGCFGLPRGNISIFCPGDIDATAEMGAGGTVVFYGQPNANSTCVLGGVTITQTGGPATGSVFPVGTTTVTYTVTDNCENSETCSFEVTVVEMVDPCADKGGDADGDGVCADDDCDDNNASVGMKMPQGTACNDGNGNTINDVFQADGCTCVGIPQGAISFTCNADITVSAPVGAMGTEVSFSAPTASTTCSIDGLTVTQTGGPASGSTFPLGTTTVSYTATDACGNTEVCSFSVTVEVDDTPLKAKVGDFVFRDDNGNGIQDANEPGIRGVFVLLTNVTTGAVKFMVTDADGMYMFGDLDPGDYTLKFVGQPNDLIGSDPGQGGDDTKDSDIDPITGITPVFTLGAGEINNDIDAGFRPEDIITNPCLANAGTLSGGSSVTIVAGEALLEASSNGDAVVPNGYSIIYVLTSGTDLVIEQTSSTPNFTVDALGKYTVHTLVYDPATLDLGIVVPGLTTGGDVNGILIQGGGDICGALDVAGTMFMVEDSPFGCPGNVTNGGVIGSDEDPSACGPFDPEIITGTAPSGGNGGVEYIWLSSTTECPTELVDQIPGATGATYNPGTISETTYFVRCSRTVGCTVWIESNCVVKTVDDCGNGGTTCNDVVVTGEAGKISISNIPSNAKIEYNGPSTGWGLVELCNGDCSAMEMVSGLDAGDYAIKVQSFNPYCYAEYRVTVTNGGGNPCDGQGGDADGDGVCDNQDNCDFTANPDQADNDGDGIGNVCDDTPDGNGNPCDGQGGDADGDGICDDQDNCDFTANPDQADNDGDGIGNVCDDTPDGPVGGDLDCNDAVVVGESGKVTISNIAANAKVEISGPATGWGQVIVCEGDCNAMEMVADLSAGDYSVTIQTFSPYCYNRVTVTVTDGGGNPCDGQGGDSDGDGVCDAQDNCDFTANPDQADNDGDGIGNVCDDTPNGNGNPCDGKGGDSDGDGICDDQDNCDFTANPDQADNDGDGIGNVCDDTPDGPVGGDLDCNDAVVVGESGKVTISNIAANAKVEISGPATGWGQVIVCEGDCNAMEMVADLSAGDYSVTIQTFSPYCYNRVTVTVTDGGGNPCDGQGGDSDGDGICDNQDNCDFTANPDQADNDGDGIGNVCDDTPNGNGNPCDGQGGDSDGDGICDNQDNCDFTSNPDQADNDGDGIGNVCDDTPNGEVGPDCSAVVVSGEAGKLIINNLTAPIVAINILDKNAGYGSIYECFNNCDVPMTMLALPASNYLVKIQFYGSDWAFVCEQAFDATVTPGVDPCADKGGDADGDGVCADDDCDDNNPNVGGQQAPGTACNDGNADTENDVIQGDGCSCAGTPVGPSKCADRTVINTQRCGTEDIVYGFYIVTNGIDKRYSWENGSFMEFDDGTAMLTGHIVNNGDSQIGFDVNINLTGRTTNSPTGAAKEHACLHPDESGYYYYADFTGTLMGTGSASGAVLTIRDHGEAFQVGVGANVTNEVLSFGASGWLKIDVQSQPSGSLVLDIYDGATNGQNGDININLTGDGTECPNGASSRNTPIISSSDISVYPNPAQEELFINLSKYNGKTGNIKVLNLYGQLVQELKMDEITSDVLRLDMSNFQNGLYHLNIKVDNAQPITKKILVSRLY